ncbi:hypothetical protein FRB96_006343 [Tulasnella sp. 330]|nr:hypothetical protein FRB96_006343 [Tulasnella sp. 330]KAG8884249.1 hypothetical protein FRB97_004754 [Tulasnella sp. 331]KAG8889399.1 hypothetical protein FRB98_004492 [Tulasnella sp. 332]
MDVSTPLPDQRCAIFWDYENCSPPANVPGYIVAEQIRNAAHKFGAVTVFKAYLELSTVNITPKMINLRSELQSSGVSLTDCPRLTARKDVVDKMLLVDMLAFALDNPAPAVIMLISGDRDFVYAVSVLRHRRYTVVVVIPPHGAHITLKSQANVVLDWKYDIFADNEAAAEFKRRQSFGTAGEEAVPKPSFKDILALPSSPPAPPVPLKSELVDTKSELIDSKMEIDMKVEAATSASASASAPAVASAPVPGSSKEGMLLQSHRTPPNQIIDLPPIPSEFMSGSSPFKSPFSSPKKQRAAAASAVGTEPVSRVTSPQSLPRMFDNLIEILEQYRLMGNNKPLRSLIGADLLKKNPLLYKRVGVAGFSEYVALAEKANVVKVGAGFIPGREWVALAETFKGKVFPVYTGP